MEIRRVFIVGDSLFAETLVQILGESQSIKVTGNAPAPRDALAELGNQNPDVVIIAGNAESITPFLTTYPDLPVIHADLNTNRVRIITNQSIDARLSDLLAAIAALPKRNLSLDGKTPDEEQILS